MNVGVFGGSFNPIHTGHLILAEEISEAARLDVVLFVPAFTPPHKANVDLALQDHRLRMVELAVADNPRFEASDIELRRGGVSYTIDTILELRRKRPADRLHFIIGADTIPELASWHRIDELVRLVRFLTGSRPGQQPRWEPLEAKLPQQAVDEIRGGVIATTPIGISSSAIRHRMREGRTIRYLVPRAVEEYAVRHKLYAHEIEEIHHRHGEKHHAEDHREVSR